MSRGEILWVGFCLTALLLAVAPVALVRLTRQLRQRPVRLAALAVLAIAVASLLHLLLWVQPAFVHAEFYGPELVTDILRFPSGNTRHLYGATGSLVLRLLAIPLGASAEGIFNGNLILSALATLPLALWAYRLSGRASAAVFAALLWAGSPLVARLARSEDVHTCGMLFALLAAVMTDSAARRRSLVSAIGALLATQLALFARQTLWTWAPLLLLLSLGSARDPDAPPRRWRLGFAASLAVSMLAAALLQRFARRGDQGFDAWRAALPALLGNARWLLACFASHPLFDLRLPIALAPLALAGTIWMTLRADRRAALWIGLSLTTLGTLPAAWPAQGASWAFRLPSFTLVILLAACGAAAIARWLKAWRVAAPALAALLVAGSVWAGATAQNRAPDAVYRDYAWLRDTLSLRARSEALEVVGLDLGFPAPRYRTTAEVARLLGLPFITPEALATRGLDAKRTAYFHAGIGCWAYTVAELWFPGDSSDQVGERLIAGDRLGRLLFDRDHAFGADDVTVPQQERAPCRAMRTLGAPVAEAESWVLRRSPPDVLFAVERATASLIRLTSAQP